MLRCFRYFIMIVTQKFVTEEMHTTSRMRMPLHDMVVASGPWNVEPSALEAALANVGPTRDLNQKAFTGDLAQLAIVKGMATFKQRCDDEKAVTTPVELAKRVSDADISK